MKDELRPPPLPQHVSNDGREIWDWAARLSAHTSRLDKMRRLRAEISQMDRVCGSCHFWMKSRECPKEKNVNGYSRGPSSGSPKCGQFVMTKSTAELRAERQKELDETIAIHEGAK